MEKNKCNEWDCQYNKDGECVAEECPKDEEMFKIIAERG